MQSALALGLLSVNLLIAGGVASDHFSRHPDAAAAVMTASFGGLREAVAHDSRAIARLLPARSLDRRQKSSQGAARRNWIQRHPSCFGAAVGFVGGFLVGFLPGDDAVFEDYEAAFNGAVLGGIGAGAGAILGWIAGRD